MNPSNDIKATYSQIKAGKLKKLCFLCLNSIAIKRNQFRLQKYLEISKRKKFIFFGKYPNSLEIISIYDREYSSQEETILQTLKEITIILQKLVIAVNPEENVWIPTRELIMLKSVEKSAS